MRGTLVNVNVKELRVGDVIPGWMPGVEAEMTKIVKRLGNVEVTVIPSAFAPSDHLYKGDRDITVFRKQTQQVQGETK